MLANEIKETVEMPDCDGDASNEDSAGEMTWVKPPFTAEMMKFQLKNKKKRVHSNSFSHSGINGLTVNGVPSDGDTLASALQKVQVTSTRLPYGKNSKKPRNGYRFSPKKRGGKKLSRPRDDIDEIELDHNDPDYDSDLNDPVVYSVLIPVLPDDEFEEMVNSLLKEFYEHGQTQEVISSLSEINLSSQQRRKLPYVAITLALQYKLSQCELTSTLLSDMYVSVITPAQMQQGFHLVLDELPEIVIDVPKAPEFVGRFIARAVADDILPPRFVQSHKANLANTDLLSQLHNHTVSNGSAEQPPKSAPPIKMSMHNHDETDIAHTAAISGGRVTLRSNSGGDGTVTVGPDGSNRTTNSSSGVSSAFGDASLSTSSSHTNDVVVQALNKAESLLTLNHAFVRLDHVWGVKLGVGANKHLVKQIGMLLREYLDSNDAEEATRCLQELDSPHFHHEVVYQALLLVIERTDEVTRFRIASLLDSLSRSVVITLDQLVKGVKRVYAEMADIQVDVPVAYVCLERFLSHSFKLGYMPKKLISEMPTKSRRRFVSEGDSLHRSANVDQD